jgi:hypothetical protein
LKTNKIKRKDKKMSEATEAYEDVINEIDIRAEELSSEDYKEFLEELFHEIDSRLVVIRYDS